MTIGTAFKMAMGSVALCLFALANAQADYIPNTPASGNTDLEASVVLADTSADELEAPVFTGDLDSNGGEQATSETSFDAADLGISGATATGSFERTPEPGTWILVAAGVSAIGIGWRKRKA